METEDAVSTVINIVFCIQESQNDSDLVVN
jgi:hypothetical protein